MHALHSFVPLNFTFLLFTKKKVIEWRKAQSASGMVINQLHADDNSPSSVKVRFMQKKTGTHFSPFSCKLQHFYGLKIDSPSSHCRENRKQCNTSQTANFCHILTQKLKALFFYYTYWMTSGQTEPVPWSRGCHQCARWEGEDTRMTNSISPLPTSLRLGFDRKNKTSLTQIHHLSVQIYCSTSIPHWC